MSSNYLFSAAIDFGTTFSGYAFSSRNDFEASPTNAYCMSWTTASSGMQSLKTSTCVLFNPKGEFDSFGFDAEDKYADLAMDNEFKAWYFFRRFKMMLYKEKECQRQGFDILESDIQWVLTVPAIWNEPAKKFMREAAVQAGISDSQLILALEPEAASLFCKHLPIDGLTDTENTMDVFQQGTKYMVFDAGGGTIDITVNEVQSDGNLKEIFKANGGEWGGTKVDEEFEALLKGLVGKEEYLEFKKEDVGNVLDMQRSFEVKKRNISKNMDGKITFSVPVKLREASNGCCTDAEMNNNIQSNPKYASHVVWRGDKIRLSAELALSLFRTSLTKIRGHLQELMLYPDVKNVSAILMVGGYSECPLLQDTVRGLFPAKQVIVPRDAGLAVLKGAVITGHCPDFNITERICRFTYGVRCSTSFKEGVHKEEYKFYDELGFARCKNAFKVHVAVGDRVKVGEACKPHGYTVTSSTSTAINIRVFASSDPAPTYTNEESCEELGNLRIEMPDTSRGLDRGVDVSMIFSGAEIGVDAVNKHTKEKHEAFFDFLG